MRPESGQLRPYLVELLWECKLQPGLCTGCAGLQHGLARLDLRSFLDLMVRRVAWMFAWRFCHSDSRRHQMDFGSTIWVQGILVCTHLNFDPHSHRFCNRFVLLQMQGRAGTNQYIKRYRVYYYDGSNWAWVDNGGYFSGRNSLPP